MAQQTNAYEKAKKAEERRVLEAARETNGVIPAGKIGDFAEPDLTIETANGVLGIEVTAVMPTSYSGCFSSPLAEQRFREDIVERGEKDYYRTPGSLPVGVSVFFWKIERSTNDKQLMGRALADFVRANPLAGKVAQTFSWRPDLPKGFGIICIRMDTHPWIAHEFLDLNSDQIHQQIAARIAAKNTLLPTYRTNLPQSPIWLLLFSSIGVSTGIPLTGPIETLEFPSDFDRVLFYSALDSQVVELKKVRK